MLMNQKSVPSCDAKLSEYGRATSDLTNAIDGLGDRLQVLESRLSIILKQTQPCNSKTECEVPPRSALIIDIDKASEKLIELRSYVESIIERLSI